MKQGGASGADHTRHLHSDGCVPERRSHAEDQVDDACTDIHAALTDFHRLQRTGELTPSTAMSLAAGAASAFLKHYAASGGYLSEAITLLCELATIGDASLAQMGMQGLFPLLVERLGDAFDAEACAIYNRLFVQVIQHCRNVPLGEALDAELRRFGLVTDADLFARMARVRQGKRFDSSLGPRIKKAFVLSRVTLGADVAVTSMVLATLKGACPTAQLMLLANPKTQHLFAGDLRIGLCAVDYPRGVGLLERLASWHRVIDAIDQHTIGLDATEYLIVDPDSRLTQLGVLPLVADERGYFFFESRSYDAPGLHKISELTAHWLSQVFGAEEPACPYVAPSLEDLAFAQALTGALRSCGRGPVVSVNLGVGANPAKRLADPFEIRVVERLLGEGAIVILDKGGEAEEVARTERLSLAIAAQGFHTLALDATSGKAPRPSDATDVHLITWHGGIGRFAGLIGASDAYIGYDSAGQHIAAALGVPTIDIFAGFSSPRMPERWSPHGPGPVYMLVVEAAETMSRRQLEALVDEVLSHVAQARTSQGSQKSSPRS
jgi:ADP-heptose:LPS heptosyltransferase